jgi:DNA polymerase-3 subunit epsilon
MLEGHLSAAVDDFIAFDVELASRRPIQVCAIGAAHFQARKEVRCYQSLVRINGRVGFSGIHGLTSRDLLDAPLWPSVWKEFLQFVGQTRLFVAFPAHFDRGALLTMCASYGLRPPPLRFVCAAAMAEARLGRKLDLASVLHELGLTFPGRHHNALSDARAAAAVVIACAPCDAATPGEA